jgi:hypothetical protein
MMNETVAGRSRCGCEVWSTRYTRKIRSLHMTGRKFRYEKKPLQADYPNSASQSANLKQCHYIIHPKNRTATKSTQSNAFPNQPILHATSDTSPTSPSQSGLTPTFLASLTLCSHNSTAPVTFLCAACISGLYPLTFMTFA